MEKNLKGQDEELMEEPAQDEKVVVHAGFERFALLTDEQAVALADEDSLALEYILHKYKRYCAGRHDWTL